jgi:hypothetical protein
MRNECRVGERRNGRDEMGRGNDVCEMSGRWVSGVMGWDGFGWMDFPREGRGEG